jgi:adenylosuccinate synthase
MSHRVTIVADLGYGDAGKGSIVDFLARQDPHPPLVVRFNGGPQAAHNVITPSGQHHTFSQFGAASFVPGTRTHLSKYMLVNPLRLAREADQLQALGIAEPHTGLTIDSRALVITPYHEAANRLRELARGDGRHGSCGHGVGETMADSIDHPDLALHAADLRHSKALELLERTRSRKLTQLADILPALKDNPHAFRDIAALNDPELSATVVEFYRHFTANVRIVDAGYLAEQLHTVPHILFEGAQGVLLDEWRGFHPYTTWSTTTFANADALLAEANYNGCVTRLGTLRAYLTRHGAGPFVTEDPLLTGLTPDAHNCTNPWQREFRVGHFDLVAARYALAIAGHTDSLAITCLDRPVPHRVATSYQSPSGTVSELTPGPFMDLNYQEQLTNQLLACSPNYEQAPAATEDFLDYLSDALGLPVTITSAGPSSQHKHYRRNEALCR